MLLKGAHLLLGWLLQVVEGLVRVTTCLALIVVVEGLRVNKHADHDVANSTLKQVLESDAVGRGWLSHVPQLIFEIVDLVLGLNLLL